MDPGGVARTPEVLRLRTSDRDRAAELLRRPFPDIGLSVLEGRPDFAFAYDRVTDGRIAVNRLAITGRAVLTGTVGEGPAVARVRSGRFDLEYGRERVDTAAPYLRRPGRSRAAMDDAHLQMIELDPRAFAAAAASRLGEPGRGAVRAPASSDRLRPEAVRTWNRIADLVVATAFDEQAFAAPLVRSALFDLLVSGLVALLPAAAERRLSTADDGSAAVRRAKDWIEAHLAEPFEVADVARAARMPVRTLQSAFRSQVGESPSAYVRRRRLAGARDDLVAGDPGTGVSVAAVARDWGFAHPGRFADYYRAVYGERPSDTLRR